MDSPQRFFVSFNSKDEQKAHWIAWTLRDAGHEVAVHTWELPAGGDIPTWMNERLAWAERLIAVVSPDYVTARYSVAEWTAKVWGDPDGKDGSVVPVLVRPTPQVPPLLAKLSFVDLTGVGEAEARRRLLDGVRAPAPPRVKPVFEPAPPAHEEQGPDVRPTFSDDPFVQDERVDVVADSSGAAAAALVELVSPANAAKLRKSERDQLKGIIRDLEILHHGQSGVIQRMQRVTNERDAAAWPHVQRAIALVAGQVNELVSLLEHFEGDLIYEDLDTFRQLQSMSMSRAGIYRELADMPAPATEEGWDRVSSVVGQIEHLLAQIPVVQERLADYLKSE